MKRKLILAFAGVLLLGGVCAFLYPSFKTAAFREAEKATIQRFAQYRETTAIPDAEAPSDNSPARELSGISPASKEKAFPELWAACIRYNEQLTASGQEDFGPQDWQTVQIVPSDYGWGTEAFGVLSIPAAEIEVPVFLGCTSENLNRGGAVLGKTSLPIGGKNTNCVIAGHRTWDGAVYCFVGLEQAKPGDFVYLTNPWETLTYRVVSAETILPDDSDRIRIQEGRDLLTVFTCTYPNTRRVLVTCERIIEEG